MLWYRYSAMVFLTCFTTWFICGSGMKTLVANGSVAFQVLTFAAVFFLLLCGYTCEPHPTHVPASFSGSLIDNIVCRGKS